MRKFGRLKCQVTTKTEMLVLMELVNCKPKLKSLTITCKLPTPQSMTLQENQNKSLEFHHVKNLTVLGLVHLIEPYLASEHSQYQSTIETLVLRESSNENLLFKPVYTFLQATKH